MHHLILGYGYCGYYLAQKLVNEQQQVTVVSRHVKPELAIPGVKHSCHDIQHPFIWEIPDTVIYYLIPPPGEGETDLCLRSFLSHASLQAKKVIYFGSSGVYGNHAGQWVTEHAECIIQHPRQLRRLDAEKTWLDYCVKNDILATSLRIAGIYGPGRLPIEAAISGTPLIEPQHAPYTNHIYVNDLVTIAYYLSQEHLLAPIYNIADGHPGPMGSLQQCVAKCLGARKAQYESWDTAWSKAGLMKKEFMLGSKKLDISCLRGQLGSRLTITLLDEAVATSLQV